MKKVIAPIILLIVTLTFIPNETFAQQGSSARYMPLAVGNKWVYSVFIIQFIVAEIDLLLSLIQWLMEKGISKLPRNFLFSKSIS